MITTPQNRTTSNETNLRGGDGTVQMIPLFPGVRIPHLRLLNIIALEPGCSIGEHQHVHEAEAYVVLEGEATVLDHGERHVLYPGDAHLCLDGESHALLNCADTLCRIIAIIPTEAE